MASTNIHTWLWVVICFGCNLIVILVVSGEWWFGQVHHVIKEWWIRQLDHLIKDSLHLCFVDSQCHYVLNASFASSTGGCFLKVNACDYKFVMMDVIEKASHQHAYELHCMSENVVYNHFTITLFVELNCTHLLTCNNLKNTM